MTGKRTGAVIGIIVLFITLCASCAFMAYTYMGGSFGDSKLPEAKNVNMSNVSVCGVMLPDVYKDTMRRTEIGNLDSRMSLANKLRDNTDRKLSSFTVKKDSRNITKYYQDNQLVRADVPSGTSKLSCERTYYYNNGSLYLADYYVAANHDKMYFADDVMFRHITSGGEVTDNGFSNANYCYLGNFALNEAKALNN